jgi:hypothetical protein
MVDEDLALPKGPLRYSSQLTKLQVAEVLYSDPDAGPKYGEH